MFKLGFRGGIRYESTPFVLSQYYPFGRSKYSTAQTTLRQLKDNLNYIYLLFVFSEKKKFSLSLLSVPAKELFFSFFPQQRTKKDLVVFLLLRRLVHFFLSLLSKSIQKRRHTQHTKFSLKLRVIKWCLRPTTR